MLKNFIKKEKIRAYEYNESKKFNRSLHESDKILNKEVWWNLKKLSLGVKRICYVNKLIKLNNIEKDKKLS